MRRRHHSSPPTAAAPTATAANAQTHPGVPPSWRPEVAAVTEPVTDGAGVAEVDAEGDGVAERGVEDVGCTLGLVEVLVVVCGVDAEGRDGGLDAPGGGALGVTVNRVLASRRCPSGSCWAAYTVLDPPSVLAGTANVARNEPPLPTETSRSTGCPAMSTSTPPHGAGQNPVPTTVTSVPGDPEIGLTDSCGVAAATEYVTGRAAKSRPAKLIAVSCRNVTRYRRISRGIGSTTNAFPPRPIHQASEVSPMQIGKRDGVRRHTGRAFQAARTNRTLAVALGQPNPCTEPMRANLATIVKLKLDARSTSGSTISSTRLPHGRPVRQRPR